MNSKNTQDEYPIGLAGTPWGPAEVNEWYSVQKVLRPYASEVVQRLDKLESRFSRVCYGALPVDAERYPLFALSSRHLKADKPNVLITGGVHGYETSGVQGAIRFLETVATQYESKFNLVVAPCVSPWGYETINRWNPVAVDPNRSFAGSSESPEAVLLSNYLRESGLEFLVHIDLHETTDTDNTEFRPALSARDAVEHKIWHIPDGFYTVGDSARPEPEFQNAVIRSVGQVTHIAEPAEDGRIIGEVVQQPGVINYDAGPLGLCMGVTRARYVTTTEVYPDSPRVSDEECIQAQVAAVVGGLDHVASGL